MRKNACVCKRVPATSTGSRYCYMSFRFLLLQNAAAFILVIGCCAGSHHTGNTFLCTAGIHVCAHGQCVVFLLMTWCSWTHAAFMKCMRCTWAFFYLSITMKKRRGLPIEQRGTCQNVFWYLCITMKTRHGSQQSSLKQTDFAASHSRIQRFRHLLLLLLKHVSSYCTAQTGWVC